MADDTKLVVNFPYNELPNVSPTNLEQIRKCLPFLLNISQAHMFYTNSKAVKYTLEFTISMLLSIDNVYAKDTFIDLLMLLKLMLIKLGSSNKLTDILPDMTSLFEALLYVSDLDVFCKYCSNICQTILQQVLNCIQNDYSFVDKALTGILENFKKINADTEVATISEIILLRFPFEAEAYKLSAFWLMEDSIKILRNVQLNHFQDESKISTIIKNILTFFKKIASSMHTHSELCKYEQPIIQFIQELRFLSPELIKFCCAKNIGPEARQLLELVLHGFLTEQEMMSNNAEIFMRRDLEKFPSNVKDWPKCFSRTFIWLCHLLFYHKRSVWPIKDVFSVIRHLVYRRNHINYILKSVCYIYPFTVQGGPRIVHKRLIVGDAILNILQSFCPSLHQILIISKAQISWIMLKGSSKLKMAALKFWLSNLSQDNLYVLQDVLEATKSERCLIDILYSWNPESVVVKKAVEVIQSFQSTTLLKEIPMLISRSSRNIEVIATLIRACHHEVPKDKDVALKIFNSLGLALKRNPSDNFLVTFFQYTRNLLSALKSDDNFVESMWSDQFWIRYSISKIGKCNEGTVVVILRFLTKLLSCRKKSFYAQEPIPINLLKLFTKSEEIAEEVLNFLNQLLRGRGPVVLKEKQILFIVDRLCLLTDSPYLSKKAYACLTGILQLYPSELINYPMLGMLIEDKCVFLSRKRQSAEFVKFILFWIKLMYTSPYKRFCYLPQEFILVRFIKQAVGLLQTTISRYLNFIKEIYHIGTHIQDDDDEWIDDFSYFID